MIPDDTFCGTSNCLSHTLSLPRSFTNTSAFLITHLLACFHSQPKYPFQSPQITDPHKVNENQKASAREATNSSNRVDAT